jgi:hypothetical protein
VEVEQVLGRRGWLRELDNEREVDAATTLRSLNEPGRGARTSLTRRVTSS